MSVQILTDNENGYSCLYCSTTMTVFGSIFYEDYPARDFLEWLPKDARKYTLEELNNKMYEWLAEVNPECD